VRILVPLMAAACLAGLATPAPAQDACTPFQLVGFTSATFNGATGVLGFTAACQQEFAASRMCTTTEILETQTVPAGLAGYAWVRIAVRAGVGGDGASLVVVDDSGVDAGPADLSCSGWASNSSITEGLAVNQNGAFVRGFECVQTISVACCAPVAIAVPEPSALLLQGSGIAGLLALAKVAGRAE
jgi:hypothetical protein